MTISAIEMSLEAISRKERWNVRRRFWEEHLIMPSAGVDALVSYEEWKSNFIAEIEKQPHTVAKGDVFVHKVLQMYYTLSEEDAIDATECAGPGDKGVDAVYIFPPEDDDIPRALVVQGKYGMAGLNLQVYQEAQKFLSALKSAREDISVTAAIDKVAGVQKNGGFIRYLIVTIEPLNQAQQKDLENIKKIASTDFGNGLVVEAICLTSIYSTLEGVKSSPSSQTDLPCQIIHVTDETYIGVASLADMYSMLRSYEKQSQGTIDTIYDHNIRKYLKRRTGSVNDGIYKTIENEPSRFIAYNNGITIICNSADQMETGLRLVAPYIVNGCQTTRTLYDVMDTKFSGIDPLHDLNNRMAAYREAFIAIKVLVVEDANDNTYANDITRYSNKQNAIKGKDFITLEAIYKKLKAEMKTTGYFLETQAGEYEALSKSQQKRYPKAARVINCFEATLCYAAGVLGKPHLAFGHSSYFAPGGEEFEKTIEDLTSDDLFISWTLAGQARKLGYTDRTRRSTQSEEHRVQTRYFFIFLFFRLVKDVIAKVVGRKDFSNKEMYHILKTIKADYDINPQEQQPFFRLLLLADQAIATFMALAEAERWYTDRSAFFKSKESIKEEHIIQAIAAARLQLVSITRQVQQIMGSNK